MPFKYVKIILILTLTLLALLLSGCDSDNEPTPEPTEVPEGCKVDTEPTAVPEQLTIKRILDREEIKIKVGVVNDFPPFTYEQKNDEYVGFSVDIAREFAHRWLGDEDALDFVNVKTENRIPRLETGEFDLLISATTHTKTRDECIDFSQIYFWDQQRLLVRKDSDINGRADLRGKIVAVQAKATGPDNIKGLGIPATPQAYSDYWDAIAKLNAGEVDALTTDRAALLYFAKDNPDLRVLDDTFSDEPYAFGVRQGDSWFRELVNFTLQDMKEDGKFDEIHKKWFNTEIHPDLDYEPYPIATLPGESKYTQLEDFPPGMAAPDPDQFTIKTIRDRGHLIAGYPNENGELAEFHRDMLREFARRWLGDVNAVEFKAVTSIDELKEGDVDLVAAMTHSKEEDEFIDFSQAYFGLDHRFGHYEKKPF